MKNLILLITIAAINSSYVKAETITNGNCSFNTTPSTMTGNAAAMTLCLAEITTNKLACFVIPIRYLPLSEGLNVTYQASWENGSDTTIQYSNGVLKGKAISPENMTTDFVKIEIAPDLTSPKNATASRKLGGLLGNPFSCNFSN